MIDRLTPIHYIAAGLLFWVLAAIWLAFGLGAVVVVGILFELSLRYVASQRSIATDPARTPRGN
jgi:hypothetical protein